MSGGALDLERANSALAIGLFNRDQFEASKALFQKAFFEQCQVVVFIADDLGFLGPGSPDLMTELCLPQDTAYMHTKMIEKRRGASPQSTCRAEGNPGPEKPKTVTSKSVTWRCLDFGASKVCLD